MLHFGDTLFESTVGLASSEGADRKALAHIARHDPARVLADVAAKRAVVELHGGTPPY